MSDEEIEAFLGLPCPFQRAIHRTGKVFFRPTDTKRWERMTLFWKICAYTGMRPGEVAHLEIESVDFGRGVFVLTDTKTVPRLVPIPPNIKESIDWYCKSLLGKFLFPSARGGNHNGTGPVVDSVDWHYDFHRRIDRLGIKRTNLTPYSLRHSLITRLLEEDVNLFKVQKIVGHRRIETTAQYTHLTTKDIQEAIRKHPLIRKATDPRSILRALLDTCNSLFEKDERFEKRVEDLGDEIIIRIKVKNTTTTHPINSVL